VNATDSADRDHTFTRAPRPETRHPLSSTRPDSRNDHTHPNPDHHHARDNLTFLISHCAEFQHALAFEMPEVVVAGWASC
jgi:hypothetical protein